MRICVTVALSEGGRRRRRPGNRRRAERVRARENCFVRDRPSAAGAILGVVRRGAALRYAGRSTGSGWHAVMYEGGSGWVSGRYGTVE